MTRSHEHPGATPIPRRLTGSPLVVAVLASVLLSALATTNGAAAVVPGAGAVTEDPTGALPVPSAPVQTPEVPNVPVPVPPPSAPQPSPDPVPSASSVAAAAPRGLGGGAGNGTEGIAVAPAEVEESGAGSGPGGEAGAGAVTHRPDGHSIGPAETAPLRRWRAYVWPAVALRIRDALVSLLAPLSGFVSVHLPAALRSFSPAATPGSAGIDFPPKLADLPSRDPGSSSEASLSKDGMSLLVSLLIGLLVVVGLGSLARLVVGEELFEPRHWRGHRG